MHSAMHLLGGVVRNVPLFITAPISISAGIGRYIGSVVACINRSVKVLCFPAQRTPVTVAVLALQVVLRLDRYNMQHLFVNIPFIIQAII